MNTAYETRKYAAHGRAAEAVRKFRKEGTWGEVCELIPGAAVYPMENGVVTTSTAWTDADDVVYKRAFEAAMAQED